MSFCFFAIPVNFCSPLDQRLIFEIFVILYVVFSIDLLVPELDICCIKAFGRWKCLAIELLESHFGYIILLRLLVP